MTAPRDTPLRSWRLRPVPRGSSRRTRLRTTPLLEAQAEVLGLDSIPRPGEAKKFPRGSRGQLELELRLAIARGMRAEGYSLSAVALQLGGGRVNVVRLVRGWEAVREEWAASMERERQLDAARRGIRREVIGPDPLALPDVCDDSWREATGVPVVREDLCAEGGDDL